MVVCPFMVINDITHHAPAQAAAREAIEDSRVQRQREEKAAARVPHAPGDDGIFNANLTPFERHLNAILTPFERYSDAI